MLNDIQSRSLSFECRENRNITASMTPWHYLGRRARASQESQGLRVAAPRRTDIKDHDERQETPITARQSNTIKRLFWRSPAVIAWFSGISKARVICTVFRRFAMKVVKNHKTFRQEEPSFRFRLRLGDSGSIRVRHSNPLCMCF